LFPPPKLVNAGSTWHLKEQELSNRSNSKGGRGENRHWNARAVERKKIGISRGGEGRGKNLVWKTAKGRETFGKALSRRKWGAEGVRGRGTDIPYLIKN